MLQHARAGQGAFLGHVADQEDRRAALLGEAHQQRRALAHLGHAAGGGLQLLGEDGLDRVDHHHLGLLAARHLDDRLDAGLGHHLEFVLRQLQAPRAHGHLLLRLLAGDVQGRQALGDIAQGLQQDGRLADAGITADQHHRAIHQAAAKHPVQLAGDGGEAWHFLDADLGQGLDLRLLPGPAAAPGRCASATTLDHGLGQGVPGPALAALPGPLGKGRAALGAAIHALGLGHEVSPPPGKARIIAHPTAGRGPMQIELMRTDATATELIANLYQFYAYESSDWEDEEVENDGRFYIHHAHLARYWQEPDWSASLILVDGFIAGFLLVERSELPGIDAKEFADLFILRKYRRRGIGRALFQQLVCASGEPWVISLYRDDPLGMPFAQALLGELPSHWWRALPSPEPALLSYLLHCPRQ